jgi:hypothetical protein
MAQRYLPSSGVCRCAALMAAAILATWGGSRAWAEEASPEQLEFFETKIRPVLVEHCYECHSSQSEKVKGKLLLDSREVARKGGESGAAILPGDPAGSLVLQALRYENFEMPPKGKLPAQTIADFEQWIKDGAVDPRDGSPSPPVAEPPAIDFAAARQFWSLRPPQPHGPPPVNDAAWPRRTIDSFLLNRIEAAGLKPALPAGRAAWLRRVSLDLVGLPPAPEELSAFEADPSPDAAERVVDRLLASPHYGERSARLWLDLARYAEDQAHIVGKDESLTYPNAYLYRDWIIAALNGDLPYDRFVQLQLAADLLEGDDSPNSAALGLLGLGPKYYGRRSLQVMSDEWEDRVDIVGRGLLGLTVACARCHDHKFDPIGTEDYYALAGVFASTQMFNRPLVPGAEKADDEQKGNKDFENGKKAPGEAKDPRQAMHIVRDGQPTDLNLFIRGNVENQGPPVPRHFLRVLSPGELRSFASGSGRRELAEAITSPENPLTARVIVNRLWGLYFGRPLVATASNFGHMGEQPTHPELLDDLTLRFLESGWSLKWLTREIVSSAAYRQSSAFKVPSSKFQVAGTQPTWNLEPGTPLARPIRRIACSATCPAAASPSSNGAIRSSPRPAAWTAPSAAIRSIPSSQTSGGGRSIAAPAGWSSTSCWRCSTIPIRTSMPTAGSRRRRPCRRCSCSTARSWSTRPPRSPSGSSPKCPLRPWPPITSESTWPIASCTAAPRPTKR